jgi:Uncharacterised nucleotidyltransferase
MLRDFEEQRRYLVMLSVGQVNRDLPEAVIASFRDNDADAHGKQLARFTVREWRSSIRWLDTSGLALYFLDRVTALGLEDCIPAEVLGQLQQRLADNRLRTSDLFDEFAEVNGRFERAGLRYVNLKGFCLVPEYCPDPTLRYQLDLDFLIFPADAPRCCDVLGSLGYEVIRPDDRSLEFRAGMERLPSINDLYKPKSRRSIEVHFAISLPEKAAALLERSRRHSMNGFEFPVLSEADMFLAQALHLFKHVAGEWIRISWLLELRRFVVNRGHNSSLWREVRVLAGKIPHSVEGLGVVMWLCTRTFGEFAPSDLTEWTVDALPNRVQLWLECYGRTIVLTEFPGTKLYLLLKKELSTERKSRNELARRRLLPLHRPPRVAYAGAGAISVRLRALADQCRFVLFRLRFHVAESSRYLLEAHRWKRIVSG